MDSTIVLYAVGLVVLALILLLMGRRAQWSIDDVRSTIAVLVGAAEQSMPGTDGKEKLTWVLQQADEIGLTKYVPAVLLRAMIEHAVYWLRQPQSVGTTEDR